jgi:phage tail sheath protein FI
MSAMKTPGVYVVEKSAFPNSVVEVATAVPAFIGYTKFALNGTKSLHKTPWRISSLAEFVQYFGDEPDVKFSFSETDDSKSFISLNTGGAFTTLKSSADAYNAAFAKAQASVDSAVKAEAAVDAKDDSTDDQKAQAKAVTTVAVKRLTDLALEYANSVTAFTGVLAEANVAAADSKSITDAVTAATAVITDLTSDAPTKKVADLKTASDALVSAVAAFDITKAAAKFYSVSRTDSFTLYYNMRFFFANGGGPCYVVSVGNYSDDFSGDALAGGIDTLLKEQEPTMVVIPEAVNTDSAQACYDIQTAVLKHCGGNMNRVAILDIYNGDKERTDPVAGDVVTKFREQIGTEFLDYAAAYYPWLNTSVVSESEVTFRNIDPDNYDDFKTVLKSFSPNLSAFIDDIGTSTDKNVLDTAHKVLYKQSPLYATIVKEMLGQVNLLPPSAAMAGIYTLTDHTKEVWKAPANTGIANVISTAVNISYAEQEDLNVPMDGKGINAIRYFTGEGIKVWGARTLDGNSLDWRYINVRRTMIMLEESIKNAAKAFVFDPNVANTWVIVRSTISNFLNGIWKRGGLAGAVPEDAYSVHIGLGDTMTPDDILEGIMRITVLVAISRPAEYIEITFMQQMQKS